MPPRGDYQTLLSFQKAELVYDLTFRFAHKYLAKGDRTIDQMIQSARSGKKNILEGSTPAWNTLTVTNVTGAGGPLQVTDPNSIDQPQRFYRVQTPP